MSARTHSKLLKGSELKLGGTSGWGPPNSAAVVRFFGSVPSADDASLVLEGAGIFASVLTDTIAVRTGAGTIAVTSPMTVLAPTVANSPATKAYVDAAIGSAFTGDISTTVQQYLSAGLGAVKIQDNQGLTVANSADSQSVNLSATGTTELTITGSIRVVSSAGLSLRGTGGTEGNRLRVLKALTVNAAPVEMNLDGAFFLTVAPGEIHTYSIAITGKGTAGANSGAAFYHLYELAVRNVAGTVTLVSSAMDTDLATDPGLPWDVTFTPDSLNGRIGVFVVGDAATSVTWVGRVSETAL